MENRVYRWVARIPLAGSCLALFLSFWPPVLRADVYSAGRAAGDICRCPQLYGDCVCAWKPPK